MLIENIFTHLFHNEKFYAVVFPYLREDLFETQEQQTVFRKIREYSLEYSKRPSPNDINLTLNTDDTITVEATNKAIKFVQKLRKDKVTANTDLVIEETERWVQDREMEMAILESVKILEENKPRGLIQDKIKNALSVAFSSDLGIEYAVDADKQHDYYTAKDNVILSDLSAINTAVGGGFRKKHLYLLLGRVNVGKTIWMCHLAASFVRGGYNVVYLTAEMSENAITQRIDANILDMETGAFKDMSKKHYLDKVKEIVKPETYGHLFVKEYPTGYANKNHIVNYLNELKLKRDFVPDILIVDYVNIFSSARLPASAATDSYKYMKAVVEEFRAIGVEQNCAVVSPSQLNRDSANKSASDVDMTGQADSWAIPATADFMGVIIQSPEMYESGNYLFKCIKTRFGENVNEIYQLGCERPKMRLIDIEEDRHEVPLSVKDSHDYIDRKKDIEIGEDSDTVWVFNNELE